VVALPTRTYDAHAARRRTPLAWISLREIVAHRELLWALVELRLRTRAKRSVVGTFWPIVAPFFLLALYVFVFRRVFNVPIPRYTEFLFAGLLPWTFVTQALNQALTSLSQEDALIRRGPFPRELLPLSSVLVMAVYLLCSLVLWVGFLAVSGHVSWAPLPAVVVPFAAVILLVGAMGMVVSVIDVHTRDLRFVLGNVLTIWFFMLPILYRPNMAPRPLQAMRSIDPMNMIVGQFRDVLHFGSISRPGHMVLMLVVCLVVFVVALTVFRRTTANLAKDV
jgi:ABC-type polysaccharide/polyol phosphate export permease